MFLSDCRVIDSNGTAARTPISAVLTASISTSGLAGREAGLKPALTNLETFLKSPVGLFSLGKSHVDGAVSVLNTRHTDAALYLLVQDSAYQGDAGASNRYWRAFTEINDRLVALSVTGYTQTDVKEERGLRILRGFVQATLDANVTVTQ